MVLIESLALIPVIYCQIGGEAKDFEPVNILKSQRCAKG